MERRIDHASSRIVVKRTSLCKHDLSAASTTVKYAEATPKQNPSVDIWLTRIRRKLIKLKYSVSPPDVAPNIPRTCAQHAGGKDVANIGATSKEYASHAHTQKGSLLKVDHAEASNYS